jgi:tripeptide aminopeptidase
VSSRALHRATAFTALAQNRVTQLATALPTHRAFHWLHLHQSQLRSWQLEMLAIPAPTFHESARAAWFIERFKALGLTNVHLDEAGNALGELPAANPYDSEPFLLVSAHLDTVFPAGTATIPTEDGDRILGPGSCDNAAGLTALLGLIAAMRFAHIQPPKPILFAANVCE